MKLIWRLLQLLFILIFVICGVYLISFHIGIDDDFKELKKTPYISENKIEKYESKLKKSNIPTVDTFKGGMTLEDKYLSGRDSVKEVKKSELLGDLEIPKINLVSQLRLGDSPLILKYSLGLVRGSNIPDDKKGTNSLIAGHRGYAGISDYFLHIDKLENGDKIYINQPNKNRRLVYSVIDSTEILPYERSKIKLSKSKSTLNLITCTPMFVWTKRLVVYAELTSVEKLK